jgi:hypothetical protein
MLPSGHNPDSVQMATDNCKVMKRTSPRYGLHELHSSPAVTPQRTDVFNPAGYLTARPPLPHPSHAYHVLHSTMRWNKPLQRNSPPWHTFTQSSYAALIRKGKKKMKFIESLYVPTAVLNTEPTYVRLNSNIPISDTRQFLSDMLSTNATNHQESLEILIWFDTITKQNYLATDDQIVIQTDGLAIGAPFSSILGNLTAFGVHPLQPHKHTACPNWLQ